MLRVQTTAPRLVYFIVFNSKTKVTLLGRPKAPGPARDSTFQARRSTRPRHSLAHTHLLTHIHTTLKAMCSRTLVHMHAHTPVHAVALGVCRALWTLLLLHRGDPGARPFPHVTRRGDG